MGLNVAVDDCNDKSNIMMVHRHQQKHSLRLLDRIVDRVIMIVLRCGYERRLKKTGDFETCRGKSEYWVPV